MQLIGTIRVIGRDMSLVGINVPLRIAEQGC
jgi:hypothetical protein